MELQHLKLFVAVADAGSISAASVVVHLAQPALSRRIQELERELGGPLLERHPRGVRLSPLGVELLAHARDLLSQHERFVASARRQVASVPLRIGMVDYGLLRGVLALALARFRETAPDQPVAVVEEPMHRQPELVEAGELDLGFASGDWEFPASLRAELMLRDPLEAVLLPASHRLAREPAVEMRDLSGERLFGDPIERQPAFFGAVFDGLRAAGWRRGRYGACSTHRQIDESVRHGQGFSVVPRSLAEFAPEGTVIRPIATARPGEATSPAPLAYDCHLVYRQGGGTRRQGALERLQALLSDARDELVAGTPPAA